MTTKEVLKREWDAVKLYSLVFVQMIWAAAVMTWLFAKTQTVADWGMLKVWLPKKWAEFSEFRKEFFRNGNARAKVSEVAERSIDSCIVATWITFDALAGTRPKRFKYPNPWHNFQLIGGCPESQLNGSFHVCKDFPCVCSHGFTTGCGVPDIRGEEKKKADGTL